MRGRAAEDRDRGGNDDGIEAIPPGNRGGNAHPDIAGEIIGIEAIPLGNRGGNDDGIEAIPPLILISRRNSVVF